MIKVHDVTKRYGDTVAVDRLSFEVRPGIVTGFLGPNGAGKSTTMRMILGLDNPNRGAVTVNGRRYGDLPAPMREVGALLDARAIQGGRTAREHLRWLAQAGGIAQRRVDEVIEVVGLTDVAERKVGGFSLGMSQRLGIATALLGDPRILLFDEPVNGLDPEGIVWIRNLLKGLAAEGRTILVSSHLMSEMEETADHVLVIGRGRLIADMSVRDLTQRSSMGDVVVSSPRAADLARLLTEAGVAVTASADGVLAVAGLEAARIGEVAAANGVVLHQLTPRRASLEAAFMELTRDSVEYHAGAMPADATALAETARELTEGSSSNDR
ncbi:MAG: ATP-binding cassette domain-containing protein [Dehalococcoidia bacterium]|nr:ATP-binding cassette domain-containing protein [Dehalococcoidia bacterium]